MGDLTSEGNVVVTNEEIQKVTRLVREGPKQKDVDEAIQRVRTVYMDKGYIYCNVVNQPEYNDETKTTDMRLKVTEGSIAYIQDIKIVGNYKTRDYVIRREIDLKPATSSG
jgi:outer membrane protein insertion porin family